MRSAGRKQNGAGLARHPLSFRYASSLHHSSIAVNVIWDMKFTSPSNSLLETSLGKHEIGPADPSSFICLFPKGNAANFNKAGRDFFTLSAG